MARGKRNGSQAPLGLLEELVRRRAGETIVGTVSVAVEKLAEELAREALADEEFRQAFRALVRERAQAIRADLVARKARPQHGRR